MASQFSISGALPQKQTSPLSSFSAYQKANPIAAALAPTAGILTAAKPSTPVKSITDNAGNTVTYHAPAKETGTTPGALSPSQQSSYTASQSSSANPLSPKDWLAQQTPATPTPTPPVTPPAPVITPPVTPPTTPQVTYPGMIGGAVSSAQSAPAIGQKATDIASEYGQKIADIGQKGALGEGGYRTTGTTPVAEGNAAVIAQTTAAQQSALAQGEQAALQGTAQGLTAQQQQTTGLLGAAALGQPSPAAYGQTVFNPITGQYEGGGGDMTSALDQYATGLANNSLSSKDIPASITGNAVLNAQLLKLAQQKNPAFNPTQQGAQTGSIADLTTQVSTLQSVANGAEANYNLLLNTAQQGGVNQTNVPVINQLTQNLQKGLTSKEAVINFQSTLSTVRSQYASILGGGTVTVDSQNRAQTAIPDDISLGALQSLGVQLKNEAQNRIAGINQQITSLQGTKTNTPNATGNIFSW